MNATRRQIATTFAAGAAIAAVLVWLIYVTAADLVAAIGALPK